MGDSKSRQDTHRPQVIVAGAQLGEKFGSANMGADVGGGGEWRGRRGFWGRGRRNW